MSTEPSIVQILALNPHSCRIYTQAWSGMVNESRPYVEGSCQQMQPYIERIRKLVNEQCSHNSRRCSLIEGGVVIDAVMKYNGRHLLSLTEHINVKGTLYGMHEIQITY